MLPPEIRKTIIRDLGVSHVAVSLALSFQRDSALARTIRKMAIERGGRLYDGTRDEFVAGKIITLKQGETLCTTGK